MTLIVEVKLTGIESLTKATVNKVLKQANFLLGKRWRRNLLPPHFTEAGARRYRYGRRSKRYNKFKEKHLGHSNALVFTGEGKREALASKKVVAKKNSVSIPLPRKFNFRPKKTLTNASKEIRKVTDSEVKRLEKFLVKEIDKGLSKAGGGRAESATITDNG